MLLVQPDRSYKYARKWWDQRQVFMIGEDTNAILRECARQVSVFYANSTDRGAFNTDQVSTAISEAFQVHALYGESSIQDILFTAELLLTKP